MKTKNNIQIAAVEREIERNLKAGLTKVTIKQMSNMLKAIGYRFDRSMDCCSQAQIMSGAGAGDSYPTRSLYPVQADDGVSAFHYQARRDANYESLKKIRDSVFAVSGTRIVVI